MSFLLFIIRTVIFWVALLAVGFFIFWSVLPAPVAAHAVHGDAVVVVTGGSGRVGAGVALLQLGRAPKLFISGVGKGVRVQDVLREASVPTDISVIYAPKIWLGHQATNTVENGTEIAAWAKDQKVSDIILVSSSYHLPRAQLEVLMAAPNLHITPFAVDLETTNYWWRKPWTAELMLREFLKTTWVAGQYGVQTVKNLWAKDVQPELKTP
jgi:uncharacterized SAM-binding protein YcdF (DUF218 family)